MRAWRGTSGRGSCSRSALLWPVMAFFTNSAIHMYAHGSSAEVLMLAGGAELGLVRGRLQLALWRLAWPLAFAVTGTAFLVHEQNPWFFARSAFLHHVLGWTLLIAAVFRSRGVAAAGRRVLSGGFAVRSSSVAAMLYSDRDVAADVRPSVASRRDPAPMRRFAIVALVALGVPAAASAHATLRSTTPRYGTEAGGAPAAIRSTSTSR